MINFTDINRECDDSEMTAPGSTFWDQHEQVVTVPRLGTVSLVLSAGQKSQAGHQTSASTMSVFILGGSQIGIQGWLLQWGTKAFMQTHMMVVEKFPDPNHLVILVLRDDLQPKICILQLMEWLDREEGRRCKRAS